MNNIRRPGGFIHVAHFASVQGERLFAHHVLAGAGCGVRNFLVRKVRRGDHDGVDVRVFDDGFVVRRGFGDAPLGGSLGEEFGVGVADGGNFGARVEFQAWHVVKIADLTGSDNGDTNWALFGLRHDFE